MNKSTIAVQAALADWANRDRAAALRLFVRAARVPAAAARIALGFALRESAWMGSDARVGDAKSAWWLEELSLAQRRQPRHPLTAYLATGEDGLDFEAILHAFSRMRTTAPDADPKVVVIALSGLEQALWFGPADFDPTACTTRVHAALIDLIDRRGGFAIVDEQPTTLQVAAAAHAAALRRAPAGDSWTAARRAQALSWIDHRTAGVEAGEASRWREVWSVWRAVQAARWRESNQLPSGIEHGK